MANKEGDTIRNVENVILEEKKGKVNENEKTIDKFFVGTVYGDLNITSCFGNRQYAESVHGC